MKISARNLFPGTVRSIQAGSVNSEVAIEIAPGLIITAVITKGSAKHRKQGGFARAVASEQASDQAGRCDKVHSKQYGRTSIPGHESNDGQPGQVHVQHGGSRRAGATGTLLRQVDPSPPRFRSHWRCATVPSGECASSARWNCGARPASAPRATKPWQRGRCIDMERGRPRPDPDDA